LQLGVRHDARPNPSRAFAVVGIQGVAPHFFDIGAAAFLSDDGDVSARLDAEYELLFTQRLIAQPRLKINFAFHETRELEIGSGLNEVELGLRLRYEIVREFAPYVGVSWDRKLGTRQHHFRFGNMPAMPEVSDEDITNVVAYVRAVQKAKGIFWGKLSVSAKLVGLVRRP
jgi:uncharacterized protein involved in copper resistance